VRAGGLGQREGLADERPDAARDELGEELPGEVGALARPDLQVPEAGDHDLPAAGVGRVDGGEAAAGRPVGGEAAAVGDDRVCVEAELAADAVEHDGRTGPAGGVKDLGRPARLAVVDHHVGPGRAHGAPLGRTSGGADDPRPARPQQLDEEDAHAAGRPEDQDLLAGADVDQPGDAQGGRPVVDDRRRQQRVEAVGDRDRLREADRGPLGVAAARRAGVGDDRPPEPALVDAVADRDDLAADPAAGDVRRPDREEADAPPGPDHRVDEHHVARAGGDHQLPRPGDRVGRLDRDQHLRAAEAVDRDRAHRVRPRSAASRPPRCRGSAGRAVPGRRCRRSPAAAGCGSSRPPGGRRPRGCR